MVSPYFQSLVVKKLHIVQQRRYLLNFILSRIWKNWRKEQSRERPNRNQNVRGGGTPCSAQVFLCVQRKLDHPFEKPVGWNPGKIHQNELFGEESAYVA